MVAIKIKIIIRSNLSSNVSFVVGHLSSLCTILSFERERPIAARKQEKMGLKAFSKTLEYLDQFKIKFIIIIIIY